MNTQTKQMAMRCQNPQCGRTFNINTPQAEGRYGVNCPFCQTVNYFNVRYPAPQVPVQQAPVKPQASKIPQVSGTPGPMLRLMTGGRFSKKEFVLSQGTHVIGRRSESEPSEIEIKDDTMSCRSVRLDTVYTGTGYVTEMTVLLAENPVYVNNKEIKEGERIQIKPSDRIILGSTLFVVSET